MRAIAVVVVVLGLVVSGCGGDHAAHLDGGADAPPFDGPQIDAPRVDASRIDAPPIDASRVDAPKPDAAPDATPPSDATPKPDAAPDAALPPDAPPPPPDAPTPDAPTLDAPPPPDAPRPDASPPDAPALPDAPPPDAGHPDAAIPPTDAGIPDAPTDAAFPSGPCTLVYGNPGALPQTPAPFFPAPTVVDFDGDGLADLVGLVPGGVAVELSRGDGTFGPPAKGTEVHEFPPDPPFVGDVDGDGLPDVILIESIENKKTEVITNVIQVYRNHGDGTLELPFPDIDSGFKEGFLPVVGDVDGDGNADVLLFGGSGNIHLFLSDGTHLGPSITISTTVNNVQSVAMGDTDGDGIPDLVAIDQSSQLLLLRGLGGGAFAAAVPVADNGHAPLLPQGQVQLFDVNNDGRADIVRFGPDGSPSLAIVHVQLSTASGVFVNVDTFPDPNPAIPGFIDSNANGALADLDGDGILDAYVVDGRTGFILHGIGDGSFDTAAPLFIGGAPFSLPQFGDIDGDGDLDGVSEDSEIAVARNDGQGHLALWARTGLPSQEQSLLATAAMADLDGDGRPDLVAVDPTDVFTFPTMSIAFLHADRSSRVTTTTLAPPTMPVELIPNATPVVADFEGDGRTDVVVVGTEKPAFQSSIWLFHNPGNGALELTSRSPIAGVFFHALTIAGDFDGDARQDLVIQSASAQLTVARENGVGFSVVSTIALSSAPTSMVVADLDHDGHQDLVVGHATSIDVLFGRGDVTFLPAVSFPVASGPVVRVADIDHDGHLDLVTAPSAGLTVLAGHGDGTFDAPRTIPNVVTGAITLGDLNDDGILDLVSLGNGAEVQLGVGAGAFGAVSSFEDTTFASPYFIRDADGDGIPDLIGYSDRPTPSVNILYGSCRQ